MRKFRKKRLKSPNVSREDYERLKQEAEALTLLSEEDEQALANEQAEKEKDGGRSFVAAAGSAVKTAKSA